MRMYWAAVAAVALAACAIPLDPERTTHLTLETTASLETSFRNLVRSMRGCYPILRTEAELYPQGQTADVTLVMQNDMMRFVWFEASLKSAGPERTTIVLRYRQEFREFAHAVPAWAAGQDGGCPYR